MMPRWHPWATRTIQYGVQEGCHLLRPYSTRPINKSCYKEVKEDFEQEQTLHISHLLA